MREQTLGEQLVGINFNPSGDEKVAKVKSLYAEIIDLLDDCRKKENDNQKNRHISVAITEAQTAQMWAVKAITLGN